MTGTSGCSARSSRNSAMPSSPVVASRRKFMSWMTRSTSCARTVASASAGDEAPSTRAPCSDNRTWKAVRTASLSSATNTVRLASRSSTLEVTEVMRKTVEAGLWLQAVAVFVSNIPGGHGGRHLCGIAGGLPGGELPDHPQAQHSPDQVVEVEPGHLVFVGKPEAGAQRQAAADDYADSRDQPVLGHEVPHDVQLAGADGPARADLACPRIHVERGEAEDAERAEDEYQSGDGRKCHRHERVARITHAFHIRHLFRLVDPARRVALEQGDFDVRDDTVELSGFRADHVL